MSVSLKRRLRRNRLFIKLWKQQVILDKKLNIMI